MVKSEYAPYGERYEVSEDAFWKIFNAIREFELAFNCSLDWSNLQEQIEKIQEELKE